MEETNINVLIKKRIVIINGFLVLIAGTLFVLSAYDLAIKHDYWSVSFHLVVLMIALFGGIHFRNNKGSPEAAKFSAVSLLLLSLAFFISEQIPFLGLIWFVLLPVFIIAILGHQLGIKIAVLVILMLVFSAVLELGLWQNSPKNWNDIWQFTVLILVMTGMFYFYEKSFFHYSEDEQKLQDHLRELSTIDSLTGLLNRRGVSGALSESLAQFQETGQPFSIAMIDIDNFKRINDQFGHAKGDEVLERLAQLFMELKTDQETVARWGGEEFLLLIDRPLEQSVYTCQRYRSAVVRLDVESLPPVTISIGLCQFDHALESVDQAIAYADQMLYEAKQQGKNQTQVFPA